MSKPLLVPTDERKIILISVMVLKLKLRPKLFNSSLLLSSPLLSSPHPII
jgi:hypothetical protein